MVIASSRLLPVTGVVGYSQWSVIVASGRLLPVVGYCLWSVRASGVSGRLKPVVQWWVIVSETFCKRVCYAECSCVRTCS